MSFWIFRLAALANAIEKLDEGKREPVDGFSPRKIRNYYLLNPEEEGERHFKLILSQTDKSSLIAILNRAEMPKEQSLRITENFAMFQCRVNTAHSGWATCCSAFRSST
ncbi:MAG: hypothetical protein O3A00_19225, partial [Planctomycetota bacterium]|nr:hypothetical protein [Planctomycetota bacterium]